MVTDKKPKRQYLPTYDSTIELKERVELVLEKYPNMRPKAICQHLTINYALHKNTVKQYRYEWKKRKSRRGAGAIPPRVHANLMKGRALKSMDRELAKTVGWKQSKNKNRMLVYRVRTLGNIKWYTNGTMLLHLEKPLLKSRAKVLICRACFETGLVQDGRLIDPLIDSFFTHGGHSAYDTGEKLPYAVIKDFKDSHGIEIVLGDKSHPTSVEVKWVYPDWAERLELLTVQNIKTIESFNSLMKSLSSPKPLDKDKSGMFV